MCLRTYSILQMFLGNQQWVKDLTGIVTSHMLTVLTKPFERLPLLELLHIIDGYEYERPAEKRGAAIIVLYYLI